MQKPLDMTLVQRGARLKRSPYFEATQRYGCWGYTIYNHMFLPIGYDDLEREYERLLSAVTVWDVSVERNTEIAGPDAFRFMSRTGRHKLCVFFDHTPLKASEAAPIISAHVKVATAI